MASKEAHISLVEVMFFPFMAQGHIIPLYNVARLFASHGIKATFITTPANAQLLSKTDNIELEIIPFPSSEVGLPSGFESIEKPLTMDIRMKFIEALKQIAVGPFKHLVMERRPSCLVADIFVPWTAEVASKAGIPWVAFTVGGYFALSVMDSLRRNNAQWAVESEDQEFVVPEFPGQLTLTRRILPLVLRVKEKTKPLLELLDWGFELAADKSLGVIVNSFVDLEFDFAKHYQIVNHTRCWSLGPLSHSPRVHDQNIENKGNVECLRWLDSKLENSVIYVCFGTEVKTSSNKVIEMAKALEASNRYFIWVLRGSNELPSGFEARNQGKGLIIRGWAPQVMILDHKATGGFVTHCGWNSTLEGVSAGVPMVTWPANFYDHSLNEKLITEILRVGVSVGAKQTSDWMDPQGSVGWEAIEAAVRRVMVGVEADEMRRRAAELKKMASKAVQQEGSSYNDFNSFVEDTHFFRC